jgi:hypothetical protein
MVARVRITLRESRCGDDGAKSDKDKKPFHWTFSRFQSAPPIRAAVVPHTGQYITSVGRWCALQESGRPRRWCRIAPR